MFGEPPVYESGFSDDSIQQRRLNSIVEENDLNVQGHELVIGAGIRGDSWIKVYYDYRQDFSEVPEGYTVPTMKKEPIIEAVDPSYVFPELSRGSRKRFKAINIAYVEWVAERPDPGVPRFSLTKRSDYHGEVPYLAVERHVPGYIMYERFRLRENGYDSSYGVNIPLFVVGEQVEETRIVPTGLSHIPVFHIPYKTTDDDWRGIGGIEKLESVLAAINDRIVQIDYILWKHSDPTAYGPDIQTDEGGGVRFGGKYIPVDKDDPTPGYMTWNSQLEGAFKELDYLLGVVFMMSETPQWLFGTTIAEDKGGTGTSHTDGAAIKARFMPILSKVKRIRVHVDKAFRDALWTAMLLENYANRDVPSFERYEPVYPTINWKDGIPRDEKELAEIMNIRTGGKPTIDVQSAIKKMDEVDDDKAREIMTRIQEDEKTANGFVDSSIFNEGNGGDA